MVDFMVFGRVMVERGDGLLSAAGESGEVDHIDFLVGEIAAEEVARLEFQAVGQALQSLLEHLLMVKCQRRQLVDGEPACHAGIVATRDVLHACQREEGDGDDALTRVAVGCGEGAQLLNIGYLQAGFFEQFTPSSIGRVLVDVEESPRERPTALKRFAAALNEQHVDVQAVVAEHDTIGRNGRVGVTVAVLSFHNSGQFILTIGVW